MTYKEAVTKADNIDVALRYIIEPNTATASAMILEEIGSISMRHLFKEKGEEALDDFIKRLEEKNKEIRKKKRKTSYHYSIHFSTKFND
tara:strand:- start:591 stop:857 length:267 start_codon:yes stop_codon:yes gene_type:complete